MGRDQAESRQRLLTERLRRGEKLDVKELLELMDALLARGKTEAD